MEEGLGQERRRLGEAHEQHLQELERGLSAMSEEERRLAEGRAREAQRLAELQQRHEELIGRVQNSLNAQIESQFDRVRGGPPPDA